MLEDIKAILRVTTDDVGINNEISDLIDEARMDLIQSGVSSIAVQSDGDPLIRRAIKTYCKANFGFDNPDADRLNNSYVMLKQHLSLASDYNGGTDEI